MGSNLSKVSCSDIQKIMKSNHKKIDKSQIGMPTDFRHTYHVGNDIPTSTNITMPDTDFLATMAHITEALKNYPLNEFYREEEEEEEEEERMGYYGFSSCLATKIDAQIVHLARTRSQQKRSPKILNKPAIMI